MALRNDFGIETKPKACKIFKNGAHLTFSIGHCEHVLHVFANPSTLLGPQLLIFKKIFNTLASYKLFEHKSSQNQEKKEIFVSN